VTSQTPVQEPSLAEKAFSFLFVVLLLFTAALVLISFPAGIYTVFFTSISSQLSAASVIQGVYIFIGPVVTLLPLVGTMGGVFAGLTVIYGAMMVLAARQGTGMRASLRGAFTEGVGSLFKNTFFVTLISICFLGFTILVIDSLETTGGVPVGSISGDAMQLLMSLTIAPLREEFGFRMLLVGVPAMALCLGRGWTRALKSLWRPSASYEGDVNTTRHQVVLAAFTVGSSLLFGWVHIANGGGWEIGKLPEAAFAGVVLSYVYIRYGFHVAVLTHWGIDYLDSVFAFFGQGVYGIPWTADNGYILQQITALDVVTLFGVASFLAVCYLGLKGWLVGRASAESTMAPQP
jgi:CAAX prenyl protease-like protein